MVEAISISSFSKELDIVDSRYVNLKIVDNEDFIFFSNYQSPKAKQFESHDQISALIYWSKINVQILLSNIFYQGIVKKMLWQLAQINQMKLIHISLLNQNTCIHLNLLI